MSVHVVSILKNVRRYVTLINDLSTNVLPGYARCRAFENR